MSYDYEKDIYRVSVERHKDMDYELVVNFGDRETEAEKITLDNEKYDIYEVLVDIETDWMDMEYILVKIVNSDGTSALYGNWNPALLIKFESVF